MPIRLADLETFDSLPHGYCVIDEQYKVLSWNKTLEGWSGKLRDDMVGTNLSDLQPKLKQADYRLRFDLNFNSGTPFVFSPLIHGQIIPCGTDRDLQVHRTYLIKYKYSDEKAALLVVENVSRSHNSLIRYRHITDELEISKQEAIKYVDHLSRVNDELNQFAYRTSHDLKAPITTAKALVKFVIEDIEDGDTEHAKQDLEKISKVMEGLEVLLSDIFALVNADQNIESVELVNVCDVLKEIEQRLKPLADLNNCTLESDYDQSLQVNLEKGRITQILENIVSNGIKYRDSEKGQSYVRIVIRGEDDGIRLLIEDNGIGIPEKHQGEVFTMFKRFSPSHSFGSGLGMAIVKKHIEFLKGNIEFTSSEAGTVFNVYLPLRS